MSGLHYQLLRGGAGVFAEMYLPKKAHYQGILYHTLTEGFNIDQVRKHFRENCVEIENYLADAKLLYSVTNGVEPEDVCLTTEVIDRIPDLFYGYSMYEVDGVFRAKEPGLGVIEERTQVIRMMFRFDLDECLFDLNLSSEEREFANLASEAYLRSHHWRRDLFIEDYRQLSSVGLSVQQIEQIIARVSNWARYICIFAFGFIVFKISSRISELFAHELLAKVEEEIWVTFFWNLIINRVRSISA